MPMRLLTVVALCGLLSAGCKRGPNITVEQMEVSPADAGAASGCEAKAMDKKGKPLAGAARNSFMKKCEAGAQKEAAMAECATKAVSKDGKPLAGAAKNAFVKKCAMGAK